MIRYLTDEEKLLSKDLYEEAFPEDGASFVNYYYTEKTKDNKILIYEEEEICAMLHLNPYNMMIFGSKERLYYIVAVATSKQHRRRGLMRQLLHRSLRDLYAEGHSFTFLLPADEAYYKPFGFNYISKLNGTRLKENVNLRIKIYEDGYKDKLLSFIASYMKKLYNTYILRDENYLSNLLKELDAELGYIELFLDDYDNIRGYRIIWGLESENIRESLIDMDYANKIKYAKIAYMARILNLRKFAGYIRLRADSAYEYMSIRIRVRDDILEENNSTFIWKLDKNTSFIEKSEEDSEVTIDIAELCSILFGYSGTDISFFAEIERLSAVYINEAV